MIEAGRVDGTLMEQLWQRIVGNLVARLDGPLHFRFIAQPLMAAVLAVLDGIKDVKAGRPAYLWAVLVSPKHRRELLKDGWKSVSRIFFLAVMLELVYQLIVHHTIYPGEMLIVALLLAILPYVVLRGPVNRIVRAIVSKKD